SKLGFPIDLKPGSVVIDNLCAQWNEQGACVDRHPPSADVLQEDDELVKVDGKEIKVVDDLVNALKVHKHGDTGSVEFSRPGVSGVQSGDIKLIAAQDDPNRPIVGFIPFDTTTVGNSPFPIKINTQEIGGPSAGLAFTLTLIDELTPGSLT